MPVGLVTAGFLAGAGKVKVTLQSELTAFLGLLKEKYTTFSAYCLSNCTLLKYLNMLNLGGALTAYGAIHGCK